MSAADRGERYFLAVDLGASSGRAALGVFAEGRLETRELHRFENRPVHVGGSMRWDALALFREIVEGIKRAVAASGDRLCGVGIDTWGVDFGLLDEHGHLLTTPYHYRDKRTDGMMAWVFETVPRERVFESTGIQFLPFNTLYQLAAMRLAGRTELTRAHWLLMMPDLFNYLLCGQVACEFTIATTTQFYDVRRRVWATDLFEALDLPVRLLPPIVAPGAKLGEVRGEAAAALGRRPVPVIAPASHDTGSAVAAVPAAPGQKPGSWAYLSSGTWSCMGLELKSPIVTPRALELNFTNEGGLEGTYRFLKNISGLWIIQELRRVWAEADGRTSSFGELEGRAADARPLAAFIDVDHPAFLRPDHMDQAIIDFLKQTGQGAPEDRGALVRIALESLAMKYRLVRDAIESASGEPIQTLHIIGGGSRNWTLNQMAADALGVRALAGPVEATAIGNLCAQAISAGVVADHAAARELIRRSFPVGEHEPRDRAPWDEAFGRYLGVVARGREVKA